MATKGLTRADDRVGKGKKSRRILLGILLGIVVFVLVVVIVFLLLRISGKSSLYSKADNSEMIVSLSALAVELGSDIEDGEDWQEGDFRYEGIHYRYNEDVLTFLFLGIDKMTEVQAVEDGWDGGQSDAVFLLVLNPHNKSISVIGIPRDTVTQIDIYDEEGNYVRTTKAQLAVQHGYGDGAELSCERSVKAVSQLFYGLPIHGYCAINMGAIPLINDAVGGIDLVAIEDVELSNFQVKEGDELHLEGMDAYHYLHDRDITVAGSAGKRLQRQKQYLTLYAPAAIKALKKDITFPVTLYGTLSKYMVTDISVDEVSYLATQVIGYSFDSDDLHVLQGEVVMGEEYEEFYVDEDMLYRQILETFYEEVR